MRLALRTWSLACGLCVSFGAVSPVAGQGNDWGDEDELPVEIHGLLEAAFASRLLDDPVQADDFLLGEVRFRLDLSHFTDEADFSFKGDLNADGLTDEVEIDIRQAVATLHAADWLDVRVGRQVLTWGTGDFVFLNDLFPKDYVSFFIGRDDEFLKAPSNSVKFTLYTTPANVDLVWTPVFEPDRFITGTRLSFFDPSVPGLVSAGTMGGPLQTTLPPRRFENGELAVRVFRTLGGYELNLYGYVGFTKRPQAFDTALGLPAHSRLAVYGASARGNIGAGIGNVEAAYYDSADDEGSDPNVPNSEFRGLVGYEQELFANFTLGLQYYLELLQDYSLLLANSNAPEFEPDEARHTFTVRSTYQLRQQTVILSLFAFVSPSDEDTHLRPSLTYRLSDAVTLVAGGNIMAGNGSGFFGQLEKNSNGYIRIRYSF